MFFLICVKFGSNYGIELSTFLYLLNFKNGEKNKMGPVLVEWYDDIGIYNFTLLMMTRAHVCVLLFLVATIFLANVLEKIEKCSINVQNNSNSKDWIQSSELLLFLYFIRKMTQNVKSPQTKILKFGSSEKNRDKKIAKLDLWLITYSVPRVVHQISVDFLANLWHPPSHLWFSLTVFITHHILPS